MVGRAGGDHFGEVRGEDEGGVRGLGEEVAVPWEEEDASVAAVVEFEIVPAAAGGGVVVAGAGEGEGGGFLV